MLWYEHSFQTDLPSGGPQARSRPPAPSAGRQRRRGGGAAGRVGEPADAVAQHLDRPRDQISVEMVYRGLSHFTVAHSHGLADDPVAYLAAQDDLGIVKRRRPSRERKRLDNWPEELNL